MSEYQYYGFRTIDRQLRTTDQAALRALSSRANISAYAMENTYRWGGPRFDSFAVLWDHFDVHVYDSNFGNSNITFVVASDRVDLALLEWLSGTLNDLYDGAPVGWEVRGARTLVWVAVADDCSEIGVPATETHGSKILDSACGLVAAFGPGDQRLSWLPWLAASRQGVLDDEPVPAAVRELPSPDTAWEKVLRLFRVDTFLLEAFATFPATCSVGDVRLRGEELAEVAAQRRLLARQELTAKARPSRR